MGCFSLRRENKDLDADVELAKGATAFFTKKIW